MSSTVVHVKNISPNTSEQEVRDFFSFCGKISSLSVSPSSDSKESQTATVTFEKETAAKTALLLDNTQLGSSQVQVSSAAGLSDIATSAGSQTKAEEGGQDDQDISQEDKPRSRIVAEYLAHGYVLTDSALQKAITLDNKHGVSNRFTSALSNFDSKYKATDRAKGIDTSYGITEKGGRAWAGLSSYFEKAMGTPTGQKVAAFYTSTNKQVVDIHTEAKRLADLKSGKGTGPASEGGTLSSNEQTMEQVPGTEKTKCKCGGDTGVCPCQEGKCACSGCAKSGMTGDSTATGPADKVAEGTTIAPIGEKTT